MKAKVIFILFAGLFSILSVNAAQADTLYKQLGEKPGISMLIGNFLNHVTHDGRISHYFTNANIPHLKKMLIEQVCEISNGPCQYTGLSMPKAHKGMNIKSADFNALVEDLQTAMAQNRIPLSAQNRLLAVLAPMKPAVDNK